MLSDDYKATFQCQKCKETGHWTFECAKSNTQSIQLKKRNKRSCSLSSISSISSTSSISSISSIGSESDNSSITSEDSDDSACTDNVKGKGRDKRHVKRARSILDTTQ